MGIDRDGSFDLALRPKVPEPLASVPKLTNCFGNLSISAQERPFTAEWEYVKPKAFGFAVPRFANARAAGSDQVT